MRRVKNPPKEMMKLIVSVAQFNGLLARWKSESYKGEVPPDLLEVVQELNENSTKYLEGYKNVND